MTATTFDTLVYSKKLKAAGCPEQQADVHAEQAKIQADSMSEFIDEKLATKKDLAALEERLTYKLKDLENKLIIRLGGIMIVSITVATGILGFLMTWSSKGVH